MSGCGGAPGENCSRSTPSGQWCTGPMPRSTSSPDKAAVTAKVRAAAPWKRRMTIQIQSAGMPVRTDT